MTMNKNVISLFVKHRADMYCIDNEEKSELKFNTDRFSHTALQTIRCEISL